MSDPETLYRFLEDLGPEVQTIVRVYFFRGAEIVKHLLNEKSYNVRGGSFLRGLQESVFGIVIQ